MKGGSEFLGKGEPVGAGLDGDVLKHGVATCRGEGRVALAIAWIYAPTAPRHDALAVEEIIDGEAEATGAADGPTGVEVELIEAGKRDHVGDITGAFAHVAPREIHEAPG